jgi:ABC-type transporter Mla MlaB component
VALLLAWKRRASAEGKPLTFAHLPPSLASLAQLYGVEELLAADPN